MKEILSLIIPALIAGLASGCGGGIKAKSGGGASIGNVQEVSFNIDVQRVKGAGLLLADDAPTVDIYAQRLNFTANCEDGGGAAAEQFMAIGTSNNSANNTLGFAATFTTTIPSY